MTRAILIMLFGMFCIPAGDTASKILTSQNDVAPLFVSWTRFVFGALLLLPFIRGKDLALFGQGIVLLRGILLCLGISCITLALKTTDIATAFGGLFFAPIVSFVTATLILKEPVTRAQCVLVGLGFLGVLCVAQPGGSFAIGNFYALLAGTFYGLFLTASRAAAAKLPAIPLLFSQLVIAAIIATPTGITAIPPITATVVIGVAASAVFSMIGNLCIILSYGLAPATRMAPFVYFQIVGAFVYGAVIFGTLPNGLGILGLTLILGSGLATLLLRR